MPATIMMVHGMWCGAWCWDGFRDFFEARGYRCIVPTLRHHDVDPAAPPPPELGTTSLLDYAADLEAEIRALAEPPVFIGHSMGGILGQILGSRGLTRALVLLTPAPPAGINALNPSSLRCFRSALLRWGFWRRPMRPTFEETTFGILNLLPPAEQRETYARFVHESGRAGVEIGFWQFDRGGAARVDAAKLQCPMLVIAGAEDRITPASVTRKVAQRYRHVAEFKEIAGHAHWLTGEPGWDEIAASIAAWLGEVGAGSE